MSAEATAGGLSGVLPVTTVRFARATDRLDEPIRFYEDGVGLLRLAAFDDHDGYSGVVYGLPDEQRQLEFTQHAGGTPAAPNDDDLIVLYLATAATVRAALRRLDAFGYSPVRPQNPYWQIRVRGFTLVDPDGWRVVLVEPTDERAADAGNTEPDEEV